MALLLIDTGQAVDLRKHKQSGKIYVVSDNAMKGKSWYNMAKKNHLKIIDYKKSNDRVDCFLLMEAKRKAINVMIVSWDELKSDFEPVGAEKKEPVAFPKGYEDVKVGMFIMDVVDILGIGEKKSESTVGKDIWETEYYVPKDDSSSVIIVTYLNKRVYSKQRIFH